MVGESLASLVFCVRAINSQCNKYHHHRRPFQVDQRVLRKLYHPCLALWIANMTFLTFAFSIIHFSNLVRYMTALAHEDLLRCLLDGQSIGLRITSLTTSMLLPVSQLMSVRRLQQVHLHLQASMPQCPWALQRRLRC